MTTPTAMPATRHPPAANMIRLMSPLVLTVAEADEAVEKLATVLDRIKVAQPA